MSCWGDRDGGEDYLLKFEVVNAFISFWNRKVYQFCAIEKVAYNENSYAVRINKHECRGSVKPLKEEFGNEEDGFWSEVPMEELHLLEVRSVRKFEKEFCLLQCCGSYVSLDLDADL